MFDIALHRKALLDFTKKIDTSFFCYDLDWLQHHIKTLKDLPANLWYALKANPLSEIIKVLDHEGMKFDVASIGELDQVLKQGVNPSKILYTGPAKSYNKIAIFIEKGVRKFVVESAQQLQDLKKISYEKQVMTEVLLRVQLQWKNKEKNVLGGECVTPFGLSPNEWNLYAQKYGLNHQYANILGFHCFQWGNILSFSKLEEIWCTIVRELHVLARDMSIDLKVLDLGGGLGIDYENSGQELQLSDINKLLCKLRSSYPGTDIWLELGRYAVAKSGVYITQVIDRKTVYGRSMLILDGGSQHLMRPTLTSQTFPVNLLREDGDKKSDSSIVHLHGSLCTSLDYLGKVNLPADVNSTDHLIFLSTGAYGFTESMPFFLCHTLPAEIVYHHGKYKVVRDAQHAGVWLK